MSHSDTPGHNDSEDRDPDLEMPEGIAPPPMPKPDLHDIVKEGPTYGEKDSGKKKGKRRKKEQKKSSHPLDNVATPGKVPKNKSGKGCCGCIFGFFALVLLLFVGLTAAVGVYGPGRHAKDGYEMVNHTDKETITISEAPDKPTYYLGNEIVYEAPVTEVPVAFAGTNVYITGDFHDNVTITGAKVVGTSSARFAKDLEVWAVEFVDEGITLRGDLKGRVMQNK